MSGSIEGEHHVLFACPAYSHTRQQCSHLIHEAPSSVAAFLATDRPMAQCRSCLQTVISTLVCTKTISLASPLSAWLLNFVELDWCSHVNVTECRACGVAVLPPSFITVCSTALRIEHLMLCVVFPGFVC